MNNQNLKIKATGTWQSIAVEIRPGQQKDPDGNLKPFYLTRLFTLRPDDTFDLKIINFADPYGKVPIAEIFISGHLNWQGTHPIADGAHKVDFAADVNYTVTPLLQNFAGLLNQITTGFNEWRINEAQSIFKKDFLPFGLKAGQIFKELDLMYLAEGLLFWGARNVDGRGFGTEEDRPTNLQIPMRALEV